MPEPSQTGTRSQGFAPLCDPQTRVLILGSLPGGASLAAGQYYANPRNGFWSLVGTVIGCDLPALGAGARLQTLQAHGIGLWDVIASAQRPGSLDAAIRDPEPADLARLIDRLPQLRAVAFNGALAAKLGRRILGQRILDQRVPIRSDIAMIDLPSSSPAHARPLLEKAARWSALGPYVLNPQA